MLAGARRRVGAADGVAFAAASAEALPFPAATFDAVVSRFGVMLFADPAAGVREMVRVARPGAVIAAAVWGAPERNPYLAIPIRTIARLAATPPQDPDAPGVFRLAAPGALAALFTAAGGRDVGAEHRAFTMEADLALDPPACRFDPPTGTPQHVTCDAGQPRTTRLRMRAAADDRGDDAVGTGSWSGDDDEDRQYPGGPACRAWS